MVVEARGNEEREKRAIEKGSREGIEKREREFEEKEGLFFRIFRSDPAM